MANNDDANPYGIQRPNKGKDFNTKEPEPKQYGPKKKDDRPSVKNPVPGTNLQRKHGEKTPAGAKLADNMRKAQADKKALNKAWGKKGK